MFSHNLWAIDGVDHYMILDSDGKLYNGEYLATYEEKWFWESEIKNRYMAIWSFDSVNPKIHFILNDKIISKVKIESKPSSYKKFHKDNDLFLNGSPLSEWSYVAEGNGGHHLYENMFGNFAWDLVVQKVGQSYVNQGAKLKDHHIWSKKVFSTIEGRIVDFKRDEEDNEADPLFSSDLSQKTDGNFILLELSNSFYFLYLHFKKDTIPKDLKIGDFIKKGQYLGNVGNSGVSYVPHLHMTVYYYSKEFDRMFSVPSYFSDIKLKKATKSFNSCSYIPTKGDQIISSKTKTCDL